MPSVDKDPARRQLEEAPDKDSSAAMEEMHIPDYVMLDFGLPKERVQAGSHPPDSVWPR